MHTIEVNGQILLAAQETLANNLTSKGVPSSATESLPALAAKIASVQTYSLYWQPDPLWWDIKNIVNDDMTEGYVAKLILLFDDEWLVSSFKGADAYLTSDGAFYQATTIATVISHTWQPSAYKLDSRGCKTKWVIRFYKTATIATTGVDITTLGGYPIYVVGKDAAITAASFLQNGYILQAYDHINCTYTGTSAASFLGAANQLSLQSIPDYFEFTGNATNFGLAYSSPIMKRIHADIILWDKAANFTNVLNNMKALQVIDGIIDLNKGLAQGNLFGSAYMMKKATFRNVKTSLSLTTSSVWEKATLIDLIRNGLVPYTGSTPPTLTFGTSGRSLTTEELAEVTGKGWLYTVG